MTANDRNCQQEIVIAIIMNVDQTRETKSENQKNQNQKNQNQKNQNQKTEKP